jgi:hypothetical protein
MDTAIIALLVVILVVRRQLQVRAVQHDGSALVPLALIIAGALELALDADAHPPGAVAAVTVGAGLALAVVLGVARARTVRVWVDGGRVLRQGTIVTLALWLVSLGLHLLADQELAARGHDAVRLGQVSVLLYLGITLAVQGALVRRRARALLPA